MTDFNAAERVARGAKLLDRKRPGWAERIDLDQLRLEECDSCILGQLYGTYRNGKLECGLAIGGDHGFGEIFMQMNPGPEYAALRVAWLAEIQQRTAGGAE